MGLDNDVSKQCFRNGCEVNDLGSNMCKLFNIAGEKSQSKLI